MKNTTIVDFYSCLGFRKTRVKNNFVSVALRWFITDEYFLLKINKNINMFLCHAFSF